MNNKIKEKQLNAVLYGLDYVGNKIKNDDGKLELGVNNCKLLLDYITNLQQENEELNKMCELYSKSLYCAELTDYKSRVEKAVEYINKNKKVVSKYEAKDTRLPLDTFMWGVDNLLNILQNGSDNNV